MLTVVANALQLKTKVKSPASYRMMEFTTLGYAIAESIGDGLGAYAGPGASAKELPKAPNALSRKVKALKSLFLNVYS
ncbi:hypothetical protein C3B58_19220 [Lactonifactor longoviformis]|uniref:hypothetical protein n=1 Tax=Lactonifactor longoviformis TaxID=341220 RepID=UPI0009350846|nr:hypothetical protein [Lactonifactor longoviformis]POP30836.1 hypothetical protein C3B58_19220 [Lactonifactor longoviformis]